MNAICIVTIKHQNFSFPGNNRKQIFSALRTFGVIYIGAFRWKEEIEDPYRYPFKTTLSSKD